MSTTLTYLAAQQHINDLRRDALHARRHVERRTRRPTRSATPRLLARLVHRTATAYRAPTNPPNPSNEY